MTSQIYAGMQKWIDKNRDREDIRQIKWIIMDGRRCLRIIMKDGGVWDAYSPFHLHGV